MTISSGYIKDPRHIHADSTLLEISEGRNYFFFELKASYLGASYLAYIFHHIAKEQRRYESDMSRQHPCTSDASDMERLLFPKLGKNT